MAGNRSVLMAASHTEQRLAKSEPPVSLLLHILWSQTGMPALSMLLEAQWL